MDNLFSDSTIEENQEFPKIPIENEETSDQSPIEEETLKDDSIDLFEIFTNLNYPSCPKKLEKMNLKMLLNDSAEMESDNVIDEDALDNHFNIITTRSFNTYSVSSCVNKIKFLKNLKEENSKLESTKVNTPSSENVQKSDILITEDLDSLIKGVKSMPVVPKLQKMVPSLNIQQPKRDDSINRKKKKNKRKRKNDRDRYHKDYLDDNGERMYKSRKLANTTTKNWDDITIEESQYFDVEDKENSFESILCQYNSMKQPAKDLLVISQILNEPSQAGTETEPSSNPENKTALPSPSSSSSSSPSPNPPNSSKSPLSETLNSSKPKEQESALEITPDSSETSNGKEKSSEIPDNRETDNDHDHDHESTLNFKELTRDSSDIWNKNSPISSASSNSSVSNMSDEETNYPQNIHLKKRQLESLRYNSILTPPTPPQPIEDN